MSTGSVIAALGWFEDSSGTDLPNFSNALVVATLVQHEELLHLLGKYIQRNLATIAVDDELLTRHFERSPIYALSFFEQVDVSLIRSVFYHPLGRAMLQPASDQQREELGLRQLDRALKHEDGGFSTRWFDYYNESHKAGRHAWLSDVFDSVFEAYEKVDQLSMKAGQLSNKNFKGRKCELSPCGRWLFILKHQHKSKLGELVVCRVVGGSERVLEIVRSMSGVLDAVFAWHGYDADPQFHRNQKVRDQRTAPTIDDLSRGKREALPKEESESAVPGEVRLFVVHVVASVEEASHTLALSELDLNREGEPFIAQQLRLSTRGSNQACRLSTNSSMLFCQITSIDCMVTQQTTYKLNVRSSPANYKLAAAMLDGVPTSYVAFSNTGDCCVLKQEHRLALYLCRMPGDFDQPPLILSEQYDDELTDLAIYSQYECESHTIGAIVAGITATRDGGTRLEIFWTRSFDSDHLDEGDSPVHIYSEKRISSERVPRQVSWLGPSTANGDSVTLAITFSQGQVELLDVIKKPCVFEAPWKLRNRFDLGDTNPYLAKTLSPRAFFVIGDGAFQLRTIDVGSTNSDYRCVGDEVWIAMTEDSFGGDSYASATPSTYSSQPLAPSSSERDTPLPEASDELVALTLGTGRM